ncbi:ferrous iron transport protein B [Humidesulfovibrio mexicanus]|uniref:Ferrous iron transport protein B n=1 Tax=Humidesulfovibrio mexicanus TaxID=147047 RepID=A0A239CTB7_9BACT|nr:ferrous iron transport protein B [Humidesulfovibrio mexicanus]SNS23179.1 ferrous iron transport protein B [Humidesulfovibrio mexicanus]
MSTTITIGLAGNPNCGKTTMFNAITGAHQHVGNWPGVTVEKKSGVIRQGETVLDIVDLPGTYSLTAYSEEEKAARNFLTDDKPDAVISVLNADALERNLYLTVQIMELGVPVVLALNMMDEVRKGGKDIDVGLLSTLLNCPAVETVAREGKGKHQLLDEAVRIAKGANGKAEPLRISYGMDLDPVLDEMEAIIEKAGLLAAKGPARWVGIKYLEADSSVIRQGREQDASTSARLESLVDKVAQHLKKTLKATPDGIIADYRYGFIAGITKQVVRYPEDRAKRIRLSDRMDKLLTHQLAGPVIMGVIIYLLYTVTFVLGEYPMGWLEDGFGWLSDTVTGAMADGLLRSLIVDGAIGGVGGVLGFVPLIMIMFFLLSALEDSGYVARMAYMLDRVFRVFGLHGISVLPFIISGGIAGGCAVPGVMAARTLKSPKEKLATLLVAPFMTCGAKVPVFLMLAAAFFPGEEAAIMSAVTFSAWAAALLVARLLRSTIVKGESTPFVMELPPYRMPTLRGLCIHTWERSWAYIRKAGTVILAISVILWAAMTFPALPEDQAAPFDERIAAIEAQAEAAKAAAPEAAAPEAAAPAAAASTTEVAEGEEPADPFAEAVAAVEAEKSEAELRNSLAGRAGVALEGISEAAGFNWRVNIALIGGFAAKEVVVSTLGTAYALGEVDAEDAAPLSEKIAADDSFSKAAAMALMAFVILYAPCFVTVVAMAKEVGWKWAGFSMVFNTVLAYAVAVVIYQAARLVA